MITGKDIKLIKYVETSTGYFEPNKTYIKCSRIADEYLALSSQLNYALNEKDWKAIIKMKLWLDKEIKTLRGEKE